ncbi:MAG: amidohydrolase [Bacteroidales bacterium]|nr:amidohydrolase [Bacteroidales bacterium]MCL2132981.1 amidohydrolase [Bacteroidales bacterium]
MLISLLQIDIVWENKEANLLRTEVLIDALPAAVRLAILPEMFNTGFSMHPERVAEDETGPTLAWLSTMAKKYNIAIISSISYTYLKQYFNRLFFVFPDGSYQTYDKRHLFRYGKENEHYTAGTKRLIVDYEGWRICPQVCYDLRFPVWSRNTGLNSNKNYKPYDLLIYIANWPAMRIAPWNLLLPARAVENQSYVIGLNRTGTDPNLIGERSFSGDSQAIDFKGNIITKATPHKEEVLLVNLDLQSLHDYRANFPAWLDADEFMLK